MRRTPLPASRLMLLSLQGSGNIFTGRCHCLCIASRCVTLRRDCCSAVRAVAQFSFGAFILCDFQAPASLTCNAVIKSLNICSVKSVSLTGCYSLLSPQNVVGFGLGGCLFSVGGDRSQPFSQPSCVHEGPSCKTSQQTPLSDHCGHPGGCAGGYLLYAQAAFAKCTVVLNPVMPREEVSSDGSDAPVLRTAYLPASAKLVCFAAMLLPIRLCAQSCCRA